VVPSLVKLQLSGNVNQRRYKKERKGMRRLEEHVIFFPVGRQVGLGWILCRSAGPVNIFRKKFVSFPILFFYSAIYLVQ
jgi:hypothetical protein